MDFTFSTEAEEAAELAQGLFSDRCTSDRLRELERSGDRFDAELWHTAAAAGLFGLCASEAYGGAGLGLIEQARVVVEAGRVTAPIPLAQQSAAVAFLSEHATEDQRRSWLESAASGDLLVSLAISDGVIGVPEVPATIATPYAGGVRLVGTKVLVPEAKRAGLFLVTANTETGVGVFALLPDDAGLRIEDQRLSDGSVAGRLLLDSPIGNDRQLGELRPVGQTRGGAEEWLRLVAQLMVCAEQLGVTEGALAATAAYARSREQFGRAIGSFQSVAHRLADGHIDLLGQRLTLWQAAWRLQQTADAFDAAPAVATAKFWAAEAGHRIAHSAVHIHGGVGIDLDGDTHRFFTAAKRNEFALGGATEQALQLGRLLAGQAAH